MNVRVQHLFGYSLGMLVLCGYLLLNNVSAQLCPTIGPPEKTDLVLGYQTGNTTAFPLLAAYDMGFYKKQSLNVKLVHNQSGSNQLRLTLLGAVDFGSGGFTEILNALAANKPVETVWAISNADDYQLWSKPEVTSMDQLKGKRFAVSSYGSMTDFLTRLVLTKSGYHPGKDTQVLQVGNPLARYGALKKGLVDVAILNLPGTKLASDEGDYLLYQIHTLVPQLPRQNLMITDDFAKKNPNTVKRIICALRHADQWITSNPDAAIALLAKDQGLDKDAAAFAYKQLVDTWPIDGKFSPESWKLVVDYEYSQGTISQHYTFDQLVNQTFINFFATDKQP